MRDRGLRDEHEPEQVDVLLPLDVLELGVLEAGHDADPGRVHEHVEAAAACDVLLDDARALLRLRDVRRHGLAAELGRAASTFSRVREASVTAKPSSSSIRPIARPMPDEPPVMSAERWVATGRLSQTRREEVSARLRTERRQAPPSP